ncbi:MAG: hypothetical protein RL497_527 [Pseudomonadota bacterium]|jgi:flagella basal body P-ring formation protein FlgA
MNTDIFLRLSATVLFCTLACKTVWAQDAIEDLNQLSEKARHALIAQLNQTASKSALDTEVKMQPLDVRLRLNKCDTAIEHHISVSPTGMGSATVKIVCNGSVHWSVYAPAQIAVFGEIALATRSLERGSVIQPGDFRFIRQNLHSVGANYVDPTAIIIGQELKRPLREGEALRLSFLDAPKTIQRGDRVTLEAQANGLSVAAPGMAMANGKVGDRIRVKNAQSNRIVDALVIAPGRVRVKYE